MHCCVMAENGPKHGLDQYRYSAIAMQSPAGQRMENVWAYLRSNKLAITVFDSYEDILDKCADAWNFFANDPERITSITHRE
jgi:hypothetical protein